MFVPAPNFGKTGMPRNRFESLSKWYGLGGSWINMGLPHYIAIDRKPEDGCDIQNAACGCSGVMMQLKLVKGGTAPAMD
jgi:hypothetical protein